MNKWEYLVIGRFSFIYYPDVNHPEAFRITNKGYELVTDFKNKPKNVSELNVVGQFIAQLGEEGWEMTGVGNVIGDTHCLYFKRPKP